MKKIHDGSKDFKSNETHQQTMGVFTRATGVLQLSAGCVTEGGGHVKRERGGNCDGRPVAVSTAARARVCDGRAGGLRAHHVLILLALELTLQLDLPGRGQMHGKEPCRVNKRMRQHGVALCTMSAQQQK